MTISFNRRKALAAAGGAMAVAAAPRHALAQTLPTGTIRVLVGFPAGGGTDVMARIIAEKLKERLGINVLVENRAGASGTLANDTVAKGPADGSVILYAPSAATTAQKATKKSLPYDLDKDLAPITMAGTVATVFVVSPTIGAKTLPEYIEWLKKNPKRQNFGTTAMGSMTHFFGVMLGREIGIPLEPVAYKGSAPLVNDLSAGHAPAGCGGVADFLTHHRAGKLRIIAVGSEKPGEAAPELPTMAQLGYPKLTYEGFWGFYAPSRMSPGLVDAWNRELRLAMDTPEMRQKLLGVGLEPLSSTPAEMATRQRNLIAYMTGLMKEAGIQPE